MIKLAPTIQKAPTAPTSAIQNHILSLLKNAASLRYADMQPPQVPNDLFNYHLQFLVDKGFVTKLPGNDGYTLSPLGIRHVADPLPTLKAKDSVTSLLKVNVIVIVSRKNPTTGKLEILNQIRKSHPSFGKKGCIGGVVLRGEFIEAAAARKLTQETGLIAAAPFRHVGMERRMLYKSGELFSDVMFPIAYCSEVGGTLMVDSDFGHNMWVPVDEAIANESAVFDSIPSIAVVLKAIKAGTIDRLPFFFNENIQSDSLGK